MEKDLETLIEKVVNEIKKELEEDIRNYQMKNNNEIDSEPIPMGINLGIINLK